MDQGSEPPQTETLRGALLTGSAEERQDLADLLASTTAPADELVLLALTGDSNDDVREHALTALTRRILRRNGAPAVLYRFLQGSEFDSRAVIAGLRLADPDPDSVAPLVEVLLQHPSALVRVAAAGLTASTST